MHQPGIEPGSVPWQGTILPLDHWCLLVELVTIIILILNTMLSMLQFKLFSTYVKESVSCPNIFFVEFKLMSHNTLNQKKENDNLNHEWTRPGKSLLTLRLDWTFKYLVLHFFFFEKHICVIFKFIENNASDTNFFTKKFTSWWCGE